MHSRTTIVTGVRLQLLLLMLLMAAVLVQTAFGQKTTEDNDRPMSNRGRVLQERPGTRFDVRVQDMLREVMEQVGNRMFEHIGTLMKNSEEKLNEKLQSFERNMLDKLNVELDEKLERLSNVSREQIERHLIDFNNKLERLDEDMLYLLTLADRLKVELDQKLERQLNLSRDTTVSISKLERNIQSNAISLKETVDEQRTQLTNVQETMLQQHNDSRQQIQKMGVELREQIQHHRIEFNLFSNKSQTCSLMSRPRDCADVMSHGHRANGVYTVYVGSAHRPLDVYCDMTTDGGGWTVFQRRKDGCEIFYRNWVDYATGFGNLEGEFWLGNDHLYSLTVSRSQRLRIDLADFNDATRYAEYSNFKVAPSCEKYKLISIGTYNGTAGDSLRDQVGQKFSTFDQDNDESGGSCAVTFKGAWWYSNCHSSNLNGLYLRGNHTSYADGVEWRVWTGYYYSLKFTEMKIRPADV